MPDPCTDRGRPGPGGPILEWMALMTEFGEYLRRRRAELQPADVGLPDAQPSAASPDCVS